MRFTLITRILKILQYSLLMAILTPISCNRDHSPAPDANATSAETHVATKRHVRNSLQKSKLDMATIMEMAPGDARDDELFRLLVSDTDFIPCGSDTPKLASALMEKKMGHGEPLYPQAAQCVCPDVSLGLCCKVSAGGDEQACG